MPAILFVCTANQCRSPIAAATFVQQLPDNADPPVWRINSAGTWTKSGMHAGKYAFRVARLVGIDLGGHKTTSIKDAHPDKYDWIAVMETGHLEALSLEFPELKERIHLLTSLAGLNPYEIRDPVNYDLEISVEIIMDMQDCVRRFYHRLTTNGGL